MAAIGTRTGAVAALMISLMGSGQARGSGVVFVRPDAAAGGDGQSWGTAYQYLQDALTAARSSGGTVTEIWVAAGVYKPDRDAANPGGTGDRADTFQLIDGVAIRGGFSGDEDPLTFDPSDRDSVANRTTLSGDLGGDDAANFVNNGENSYHVVTGSGNDLTAILDGFTISGGNAATGTGGGMLIDSGSPTLVNCAFSLNSSSRGGGIYNNSGSPTLTNCSFDGNAAPNGGGGMASFKGNPILTDCTFSENSAGSGGGIWNVIGGLTLTRCAFNGNSAGTGGGCYNVSPAATLTNCRFCMNSASSGAGGLHNAHSSMVINCEFNGNTGSGMYNVTGNPTLINCTFSANSVLAGAGGVSSAAGNPTLTNCILWGNGTVQITGAAIVTYSCVQGGWPGQGNIDVNPSLVPAADGGLRLRHGSPCIDAGNNAVVPAVITTDLAGNPRFIDDPDAPDRGNPGNPPGPVVDIGASEHQLAPSERLYVDDNAAPGGNGQNWASAFRYLQDALALAQVRPEVTEIWVAAGVYRPDRDAAHPDGTGDRTATFQLTLGVGVYGGFPGQPGQEGDFSVRDPDAYPTILSGDLAANDGPGVSNNGENSYHVVTGSATLLTTILDGFTISGGNANGSSSPHNSGGGMYNSSGSPTLRSCTFSGNRSAYSPSNGGSGMYNSSSSPAMINCTFDGGGTYAMYNLAGSPALTNCTFTNGGMYNSSSNPTLINCTFDRNSAAYQGGGMYNSSSSPTLNNCTFNQNSAQYGGGIYNSSSSPTLTNCRFSGNFATFRGGGIYNLSSSPRLTSCAFAGNSTGPYGERDGAGMVSYSSTLILVNCTFQGNSAGGAGGGIANRNYSRATLTNCTFEGNSANWAGGGVYNDGGGIGGDAGGSTSILANCILWNNVGGQITGGTSTMTHCCVQGAPTNEKNINSDPLFVNAGGGDLRLSPGSPCIDAGSNLHMPAGVTVDMDGRPRFMNDWATADCPQAVGTCGTAPIVDMGAYEFVPNPTGDLDVDSDVDEDDLAAFQACGSGPGISAAGGCESADFDRDGDVDQDDFGLLQRCFSGKDQAVQPGCAG